MSYYGIDHAKDSLPRISGSRITDNMPRSTWHSTSVRFIDDDDDDDVGKHSRYDIWADDTKHKYGKSKSSMLYRHTQRPTSADSSASSSISSLKDSTEVSIQFYE